MQTIKLGDKEFRYHIGFKAGEEMQILTGRTTLQLLDEQGNLKNVVPMLFAGLKANHPEMDMEKCQAAVEAAAEDGSGVGPIIRAMGLELRRMLNMDEVNRQHKQAQVESAAKELASKKKSPAN
jgi:hypothetical protein